MVFQSQILQKYYEVRLFLKEQTVVERNWHLEEIEKWTERIHSIKQYHKWDYISKSSFCYLEENQVQENQKLWIDL